MNIYSEIKRNNYREIKVFGISLYKKTYKNGFSKRKYLFGLYKTRVNSEYKKYYVLGIQFYCKNLNSEKILPKYNYNNAFIMEYFCKEQYLKYINNPVDIDSIIKNSKNIILSASENYIKHSHGG